MSNIIRGGSLPPGPVDAIRQALLDMPSAPPSNASPEVKSNAVSTYEAHQANLNDLVKQGVLAYYDADTGKPQAAAGTAAFEAQIKDMEAPQNKQKFEEAKASLLAAISVPSGGNSTALGNPTLGGVIGSALGNVANSMAQHQAVGNALADLQLQADVNNAEAAYTDSNGHVSSAGALAGMNVILSERGGSAGDALGSLKKLQNNDPTLGFANSGSAVHEVLSQFNAAIDSNQFDAAQKATATQDLRSLLGKLPADTSPTDLQTMALERQGTALAQNDLSKLDPTYKPTIVTPEPEMHNKQVPRKPEYI